MCYVPLGSWSAFSHSSALVQGAAVRFCSHLTKQLRWYLKQLALMSAIDLTTWLVISQANLNTPDWFTSTGNKESTRQSVRRTSPSYSRGESFPCYKLKGKKGKASYFKLLISYFMLQPKHLSVEPNIIKQNHYSDIFGSTDKCFGCSMK